MKLTEFLALYGAVLSTVVFAWNALAARPKYRVRLAFAVETKDGVTQSGLGVSVQNPSSRAVHITGMSFLYPISSPTWWDRTKHVARYRRLPTELGWCHCGLSLHGIEDGCPVTIQPGASHFIIIPRSDVDRALRDARRRVLKVTVQDALWRNRTSSVFQPTWRSEAS